MDEKDVVEVVTEIVDVGEKLIEAGLEFIRSNKAGDAEGERQAILKANRVASDEIARREAKS